MRYDIRNRQSAIRNVQSFLLEISYAFSWLPHLAIDGIYGVQTTEAVRLFQDRYGLPATGETDFITFTLLCEKYREALLANHASREKKNE